MGIDRGPRPEAARRERVAEAQARAKVRAASGEAQARARERAASLDVRGGSFRPRTQSSGRRRLSVILASLAIVLVVGWFAAPPLFGGLFRALAEANPDLMHVGFIADAVEDVMDGRLDKPAGTDPTPVEFLIQQGASSGQITEDLVDRELVTDRLAFSYILATEGTYDDLKFGTHILNRTMSPRQVAVVLSGQPSIGGNAVSVALRQGLRLEQIVAYLQTLPLENLDAEQFYMMAKEPPASVRQKFGWLRVVPEGQNAEGFLGSGVFDVPMDIDAAGMLEVLLQRWQDSPSHALIAEAESRGLDFYSTVILASIVEREAILDSDRPLIAGVYQNRVDGLDGVKTLNADPVLIYAKDLMALREQHISQWPQYRFWTTEGMGPAGDFVVPPDLAGYQVWHSRGLPPGPICTPGLASLRAALNPDTKEGFLYFLAKGDGTNGHVFARTYAEHLHNIDVYIHGRSPDPATPTPDPASSGEMPSPEASPTLPT